VLLLLQLRHFVHVLAFLFPEMFVLYGLEILSDSPPAVENKTVSLPFVVEVTSFQIADDPAFEVLHLPESQNLHKSCGLFTSYTSRAAHRHMDILEHISHLSLKFRVFFEVVVIECPYGFVFNLLL